MKYNQAQYDMRFRDFIRQIMSVRRMQPRDKFLYPLMDGVPFRDLETAMLMVQIDYDVSANDNANKV